jgi:hypothetical protein
MISIPVPLRSPLFGGGAEDGPAVMGRRMRWISKADQTLWGSMQPQIRKYIWDHCSRGNVVPAVANGMVNTADAIVVSEEIIAITDSTGAVIPSKPLMPPNTSVQITGIVVLRLDPRYPRVLFIDLICTTPGRSQSKTLVSFILQKANELGYAAIRFGNTKETVPLVRRFRKTITIHPRPPRPSPPSPQSVSQMQTNSMQTDSDNDDDEDEDDDNDRSGGTDDDETGTDVDDDDDDDDNDMSDKDEDDVDPQQQQQRQQHNLARPMIVARPFSVTECYNRLIQYLERQRVFRPKCGGHLLQFVPDDKSS